MRGGHCESHRRTFMRRHALRNAGEAADTGAKLTATRLFYAGTPGSRNTAPDPVQVCLPERLTSTPLCPVIDSSAGLPRRSRPCGHHALYQPVGSAVDRPSLDHCRIRPGPIADVRLRRRTRKADPAFKKTVASGRCVN